MNYQDIYNSRGVNYYSPIHLIMPYLINNLCGLSVLDLGCGDGRILVELSKIKHFDKLVGVDISSVRIEHAKKTLPNAKFYNEDIITYLKNNQEKFDVILLFEVLEHLDNDIEVFDLALTTARMVLGSVPINIPDITHIRVFQNEEEIVNRFGLRDWIVKGEHLFFKNYHWQ